jgi:hypothetical protein
MSRAQSPPLPASPLGKHGEKTAAAETEEQNENVPPKSGDLKIYLFFNFIKLIKN